MKVGLLQDTLASLLSVTYGGCQHRFTSYFGDQTELLPYLSLQSQNIHRFSSSLKEAPLKFINFFFCVAKEDSSVSETYSLDNCMCVYF